MSIHNKLDVWQEAIDFVSEIYIVTKSFPKDEVYGLTNQIRRSAVSIPSNIAEGSTRQSDKEFIQFLYIAMGSLSELETQIIIATNLSYIRDNKMIMEKMEKIGKMTMGLIRYLKSKKSSHESRVTSHDYKKGN